MPKYLSISHGLPFWNEEEIKLREHFIDRISFVIKDTLLGINPAWQFFRCETPILTPLRFISWEHKNSDDLWCLNNEIACEPLCLRPETTWGSYAVAQHLEETNKRARPPFCVWQAGKSFRCEKNDGASASKLRFNEFYQLEFQCIYGKNTKADYRKVIEIALENELAHLGLSEMVRVVKSDRLPSYSSKTNDIELCCKTKGDLRMIEVASISSRTDYSNDLDDGRQELDVLEIAIGLDRLVIIHNSYL